MLGPYPTAAVIEQLALREELKIVGGAADLDVATKQPPRAEPAVYVLAEESSTNGGDYTEYGRQRVRVVVKTILWVRHAGAADTGARAVARMADAERIVREQLLGFVPDDAHLEALTFRASGADQYYGTHLVRQVLWDAAYTLTKDTP